MRIVCSLNNPDESELLWGKKHLLDRLDVKCTYSFLCDNCRCDKKHEVFTTRCALCLYSLVGFGRNYFVCSCCHIAKKLLCGNCSSTGINLNFNTMKICVAKNDLPKEMKLMEINKYLEI